MINFELYMRASVGVGESTNTKSLAKEFSKILIFEYLGYLKMGFDVFLTLFRITPHDVG